MFTWQDLHFPSIIFCQHIQSSIQFLVNCVKLWIAQIQFDQNLTCAKGWRLHYKQVDEIGWKYWSHPYQYWIFFLSDFSAFVWFLKCHKFEKYLTFQRNNNRHWIGIFDRKIVEYLNVKKKKEETIHVRIFFWLRTTSCYRNIFDFP